MSAHNFKPVSARHFNANAADLPDKADEVILRPLCGAPKRGAWVTGNGSRVTCDACLAALAKEAVAP